MRIRPSTRLKTELFAEYRVHSLQFGRRQQGQELVHGDKECHAKTTMLIAATQPLISTFLPWSLAGSSSRAALAEKRRARKPSDMACPSVITPRTTGHAIHLCFSEGRSSGSLWVTISPDDLRTAIPQACGERIMTPSITAWPPTEDFFSAFQGRKELYRRQKTQMLPPTLHRKQNLDVLRGGTTPS